MAADVVIERLVTRFEADISDVRLEMRKMRNLSERTTDDMGTNFGKLSNKIKSAFSGIAASLSVGVLAKQIIDINVAFGGLEARLRTLAKGSAALAGRAFDELAELAGELPFSIDQTIDAFTRLGLQGIAPTADQIKNLANVAAAIGTQGAQSLKQVVEALADAAAGNFNERLQELGIKAKVMGDKVTLSIGNTTKTINKNAKEVIAFFDLIGRTEFAGAATSRMDELEGALSGLSDAFELAARDIGKSGFNEAIATAANAIAKLVRPTAGVGIEAVQGIAGLFKSFTQEFGTEIFFMQQILSLMGRDVRETFAPMEGDIIGAKDAVKDLAKEALSAMEEIAKGVEGEGPTKEELEAEKKEQSRMDRLSEEYESTIDEINRIRERLEARFARDASQVQGETFALGGPTMPDINKERERDRDRKRLVRLQEKVVAILEKIFKSAETPEVTRTIPEMG